MRRASWTPIRRRTSSPRSRSFAPSADVLADLGRVSFMDSTALGALVRAVRELGENGADVRVVLPHGTARRIFEITALDGALPVAHDREAALTELNAR